MNWQHDWRLMAVVSIYGMEAQEWQRRIADLIEGGVTCVQLREKNLAHSDFLEAAQKLSDFMRGSDTGLIINDDYHIAHVIQASGVHIGERDASPAVVRAHVGSGLAMGVSISSATSLTHYGDIRETVDPTYYGVGPVFSTPSKLDAAPALGIEATRTLVKGLKKPTVAIGGITLENLDLVLSTGVTGVAAISALWGAEHPKNAARQFRLRIERFQERADAA